MMRRFVWLVVLCFVGGVALSGCSNSSSSSKNSSAEPTSDLQDYSTGVMTSLAAVEDGGGKTVLPAGPDIGDIDTDGNWIVWQGRSINLSYFDGTDLTAVDSGLVGANTPWEFNECEKSDLAFDGETLYFLADDVSDAEGYALYQMTPGSDAELVAEVPTTDGNWQREERALFLKGDMVYVYYQYSQSPDYVYVLYALDLTAGTPSFTLIDEDTFNNANIWWTPNQGDRFFEVGGYVVKYNNTEGRVVLIELATGTEKRLTGDGDAGTHAYYISASNDILTWEEGGKLFYFDANTMGDSVELDNAGNLMDSVAGTDYFVWRDSVDNMFYILTEDIPGTRVDIDLAGNLSSAVVLNSMVATEDHVFFVDEDDDGNKQLMMSTINRAATGAAFFGTPVQISANGEGAEKPGSGYGITVDGRQVYAKFTYSGIDNP